MRKRVTMMALGLLLAGCASDRSAPPPVRAASRPQVPSVAAASSADYVRTAGSLDLLAIRASELAVGRSSRHSGLAQRLIAEHGGTAAQLSIAGRRLNLLPSTNLLAVHQEQLAALDRATDFDPAYIDLMRALHEREIALHSAFAARGESPTLRPVAANAAAMARAHLALVDR